jgi:uncharacterized membrane protein YecN with MAPEG domain
MAHALRHSATRLLECLGLGSTVFCAACHETAEHDSWVRDAARVELVRKTSLTAGKAEYVPLGLLLLIISRWRCLGMCWRAAQH